MNDELNNHNANVLASEFWLDPPDDVEDDMHCLNCGAELLEEPDHDSPQDRGYCDEECEKGGYGPNMRALLDIFSADEPRLLNKRVFGGTGCGASISVRLNFPELVPCNEDLWIHNGSEKWEHIKGISAFTIQTIVEGSDVTVDSGEFSFPLDREKVSKWIEDMEQEADFYWKRDNTSHLLIKRDNVLIGGISHTEFEDEPKWWWNADEPGELEKARIKESLDEGVIEAEFSMAGSVYTLAEWIDDSTY